MNGGRGNKHSRKGGPDLTREFSVVLPIKDELEYFKQVFPSYLALRPKDLVLCLDDPPPTDVERVAKDLASTTPVDLNIVKVGRDKSWNFHQGHVRREGYLQARHDKIFTSDVDVRIVPQNVLEGFDLVGKNGIAAVTFAKFPPMNSPVTILRALSYHARRLLRRKPFTGIYWLYRPYYLDLVPDALIRSIYNGEDTLLKGLILTNEQYGYHYLNKVGCFALSEQNEDLPWRQYVHGLWFAKNRHRLKSLRVMRTSILQLYPHMFHGYVHGLLHPEESNLNSKNRLTTKGKGEPEASSG